MYFYALREYTQLSDSFSQLSFWLNECPNRDLKLEGRQEAQNGL